MGVLAAGRLNQRVTLERKVSQRDPAARDAVGQPLDQWEPVATVWANVKTVTGSAFNERQAGGTEISAGNTSIRIRARDDIEPTMRVIYRGKVYDIRAVLRDDTSGEFVDLSVTTGAAPLGG